MSEFVLESALASAAETLADRQIFRLDEEQWEAFVEALDASPQMHPRMARLLCKPTVLEQGSVGGARCAAIGSNRSRPTIPWML